MWLLTYVHHDVKGPYRASGPIYVRERAVTPDEWREIRRLLGETDAVESAYRVAVEYATTSKRELEAFAPSPERVL